MHSGEKLGIESSVPVDLSVSSTEHNAEVRFCAGNQTTLKMVSPQAPTTLVLDRRQIHPAVRGNAIVLSAISKGEHVVQVRY